MSPTQIYMFYVPGYIPGVPGLWPAGNRVEIGEDGQVTLVPFGSPPAVPDSPAAEESTPAADTSQPDQSASSATSGQPITFLEG